MNTVIIAEAGANHNRNYDQALALIDVAKEAGADICKFQTYSSETLYAKNVPNFAGYKNVNQLIKDIELPREWQKDLKEYCDYKQIEFMSTPFDEKAVEELVSLNVKRLKIAGFESTDFRFVDMVASTKLPLIISLGIGFSIKHLDRLLNITSKHNNTLSVLHCNNAYPTPLEDIDLQQLDLYKNINGISNIGLSDHTTSIFTPSLAVVKGASIIEKHFTLSKYMYGPDHKFALEPQELRLMIDMIKDTEKTLIPNNSTYSKSEKTFVKARRSVISKRNINKGEILTTDNITTKRPFLDDSVPAENFYDVINKRVNKNINEDTIITFKDIV
jgi:N,N'-diacetyllegionaminate synthase